MNYKLAQLLSKIDYFYKSAGLVKVPDTLLKEVEDWAVGFYCLKVLKTIDKYIILLRDYKRLTPETEKNLIVARGICKKLSTKDGRKYDKQKIFSVPTESFSYHEELDPITKSVISDIKRFVFVANFHTKKFKPTGKQEGRAGSWTSRFHVGEDFKFLGQLDIYKDLKSSFSSFNILMANNGAQAFINNLNYVINSIKDTVKHELTHFMQDALENLTVTMEAGLPSKTIRDKNFNPRGDNVHIPELRIQHPLRDVEFYTRLKNAVDQFNREAVKIPHALRKDYAKAWITEMSIEDFRKILFEYIRQNQFNKEQRITASNAEWVLSRHGERGFFDKLKKMQPLKYEKAVKEFYKAVGL